MLIFAMSEVDKRTRAVPRTKQEKTMTREVFNKLAETRFSAMLGFKVDCGMVNAKEGLFVSIIAEGNRTKEMATLPNIEGEIDFDAELNETFAYVKLN